jgi:Domain of unknown function (DUF4118)
MKGQSVSSTARSPWVTYGVAVAAAIAGLIVRLPFAALLGYKVPYITFFLATAVSAGFGGLGPGLVTTLLGVLLAWIFFIPPGRVVGR